MDTHPNTNLTSHTPYNIRKSTIDNSINNYEHSPRTRITILHVLVKFDTGDHAVKVTTVVPAGRSACNCLAHDGEASTYLQYNQDIH